MNQEHDPAQVEARADEWMRRWLTEPHPGTIYDSPIRVFLGKLSAEVAARESALVAALNDTIGIASRGIASGWSLESVKSRLQTHRDEVLAAHRAATRPPEPTLSSTDRLTIALRTLFPGQFADVDDVVRAVVEIARERIK